uniref:Uncharacterized protein n=1 Tax=Pristionchus pacificus TaxID=54126 RepID=A0A2A6CM18_PRIPA|eukprot:PDM79156.1 hypothetical protein PRIPAC_31735 [Pristionchus pacificus]
MNYAQYVQKPQRTTACDDQRKKNLIGQRAIDELMIVAVKINEKVEKRVNRFIVLNPPVRSSSLRIRSLDSGYVPDR